MNSKKSLSLFLITSLATNSGAVSVAQLINTGKIPAVQDKKLNLSGLHIDSLAGLAQIPGIETVEVLALNDNDLTVLPARGFSPAKNARAIGLERNKISKVEPFAFEGCTQLKSINLNNNKLSSFEKNAFAGPAQLDVLSLNRNPWLTGNIYEKRRLKKELPQTKITTVPFSKQQWVAIGVGAAVIAAAIAAAVGVRYVQEQERKAEETAKQQREVEAAKKQQKAAEERETENIAKAAQVPVQQRDTRGVAKEFLTNPRAMTLLITSVNDKNKQAEYAQNILWVGVERNDVPFKPIFEIVRPYIKDLKGVRTTVAEETITPLYSAIAYGNTEAEQVLIGAGLGIDMLDLTGSAPLHAAAKLDDKEQVKRLLERRANTNKQDHMGRTPLHWAVLRGSLEIAETLLNDPLTVPGMLDKEGNSALDYAMKKLMSGELPDEKIPLLLIKEGAQLSEKSYNFLKGKSRDLAAKMKKGIEQAQRGRESKYKREVEEAKRKAEVEEAKKAAEEEIQPTPRVTAWAQAIQAGTTADLESLLRQGADINEKFNFMEEEQVTPLMAAAIKGDSEKVAFFVKNGADIRARDKKGRTAADLAWNRRHKQITIFLEQEWYKKYGTEGREKGPQVFSYIDPETKELLFQDIPYKKYPHIDPETGELYTDPETGKILWRDIPLKREEIKKGENK